MQISVSMIKSNGNNGKSLKKIKNKSIYFMLPVGYREILVKIFSNLTLVPLVKIPIFTFLLPGLIAHASQPDGNMTSFTLHFSRLT